MYFEGCPDEVRELVSDRNLDPYTAKGIAKSADSPDEAIISKSTPPERRSSESKEPHIVEDRLLSLSTAYESKASDTSLPGVSVTSISLAENSSVVAGEMPKAEHNENPGDPGESESLSMLMKELRLTGLKWCALSSEPILNRKMKGCKIYPLKYDVQRNTETLVTPKNV